MANTPLESVSQFFSKVSPALLSSVSSSLSSSIIPSVKPSINSSISGTGTMSPQEKDHHSAVSQYIDRIVGSKMNVSSCIGRLQRERERIYGTISGLMKKEKSIKSEKLDRVPILIDSLGSKIIQMKTGLTKINDRTTFMTIDLKRLDHAKRNISSLISVLDQLKTIISGVSELDSLVSSDLFLGITRIPPLLKKLNGMPWKELSRISLIKSLYSRLDKIQGTIKDFIYNQLNSTHTLIKTPSKINDIYMLIDSLPMNVRQRFIDYMVDNWLKEYCTQFNGRLEIVQRFNFLKKEYQYYQNLIKSPLVEHGPNSLMSEILKRWNLWQVFLQKFALVTTSHISEYIENYLIPNQKMDGIELINQLKMVIREEKKMVFDVSVIGLISCVYEKYTSYYVHSVKEDINSILSKIWEEESWGNKTFESPSDKVLQSAILLMECIREHIFTFSKLNTSNSLLKLFQMCMDVISSYILRLYEKLGSLTDDGKDRISIFLLLNTSDYGIESVTDLTRKINHLISQEWKSDIVCDKIIDQFNNLKASSVNALVKSLGKSTLFLFEQMTALPWSYWEIIEDESEYMKTLVSIVKEFMDKADFILYPKILKNVSHSIVRWLLVTWDDTITRCGPINSMGGSQLLLDLEHLKSNMTIPLKSTLLSQKISLLESKIKLIITPSTHLLKLYREIMPSRSFDEFQSLLDIKGIKGKLRRNILKDYISGDPLQSKENLKKT